MTSNTLSSSACGVICRTSATVFIAALCAPAHASEESPASASALDTMNSYVIPDDFEKHESSSGSNTKEITGHDPYAKFNKYTTKGFDISIPGPSAYIDQDPGGLRTLLDEYGFGYWGYSLNKFAYDVRNGSNIQGGQVYNGQKFTYTANNFLYFSYDLTRHGVADGQISMSLIEAYSTWEAAGPNMFHIGVLQYHQTFFKGRMELTTGNLANSFNYAGIYVGGNVASGAFGVNSSIPSQVGMSSTFLARPGANLKFNLGHGFYDLAGVQRSINPDGASAEQDANPTGLSFKGNHVGNLWLNEIGYRSASTHEKPEMWIRAGYMKNTSSYSSKATPGTRENGNHAAYLLVDRQLSAFGHSSTWSGRGLYTGFSIMTSPADRNVFSEYDEWRLYIKGPFDNRPADMMSFVLSRNVFSSDAVRQAKLSGLQTEYESTQASFSYSGVVYRGITLTGGLTYANNPRPITTSDQQHPGWTLQFTAHIYF